MSSASEKISILIIFLLAVILFQSSNIKQTFENTTEKISCMFEPNPRLVSVENFGDEGGMSNGYWNGADHRNSKVMSHGPPVGGTQSAAFQLYQQAVNSATPTVTQLENASNLPGGGYGYIDTPDAPGMVPFAGEGTFYDASAVDFGNRRAELISPCSQNSPTFVASSLLPKVNLPGVPSWDVTDTTALANQDFLSASQQIGVDTVLSSLRNPSIDIRNSIPNPINVVSPWMNSTITPDLQRRPLDAYVPQSGVYGAGINNSSYGSHGGPLGGMR